MNKAALADLERRLTAQFHDSAQTPRCPICGSRSRLPLHAHHCVDASFLDRELRALVTPEHLIGIRWDARNALGACSGCHLNDHFSMWRRIVRRHIPPAAWEFARELDALTGDERFSVRLELYPVDLPEAA